jgi:hypothetical protein
MPPRIPTVVLVLALSVLPGACSDAPDTPEQRVRALIHAAQQATEERDWRAFEDFATPDYSDRAGRDRRDVVRLAAGYMLRNRSIHLFTRIASIEVLPPDQAEAVVYVAMAGSPVTGLEQLLSLSADLLRFDLKLREVDGEYRVFRADWKPARPEDFALLGPGSEEE